MFNVTFKGLESGDLGQLLAQPYTQAMGASGDKTLGRVVQKMISTNPGLILNLISCLFWYVLLDNLS